LKFQINHQTQEISVAKSRQGFFLNWEGVSLQLHMKTYPHSRKLSIWYGIYLCALY
jgi:hypothetical protein